ncbi:hypothetical protein QTH28_09565 [Clostridium perfringens]|nr:hypothetical protein [Clostridium perfringens]
MGGGGNRCCLYNYFYFLGLKPDFHEDEYVFNNNSRMMYTSSINEEMKKICLNSSCGNFFKVNGKSFVDDENYIPDLGLEVYKYKGKYFVTSDGNHRLCALKKIKSKKAKVKIINLEDTSIKSYFDIKVEKLNKKQLGIYNMNEYTFPYSMKIDSNKVASKILKDYYLKMNNLNIND